MTKEKEPKKTPYEKPELNKEGNLKDITAKGTVGDDMRPAIGN